MTHPFLIPSGGLREFPTSERCFITELLNDPSRPDVSLARARVAPGMVTQLHALDVEETYLIEVGSGMMEVDGHRFRVGPGDGVRIPKGTSQRIENDGGTDLVFLCLCQPHFRAEGYINLEPSAGEPS
ncbi:cupin domain-containing protein [Pleomorphomonas oryzae]|uniref:cupin domain-containing protein n=1 Tax=Pleomorphomonas oryzae TaxID=261934 RepID=UPI00041D45EF|nr:cupin domain-containing protein [Pleomorphomonas oryzae]